MLPLSFEPEGLGTPVPQARCGMGLFDTWKVDLEDQAGPGHIPWGQPIQA